MRHPAKMYASSTVLAPARPHAFDENRVPCSCKFFLPKLQPEPPDSMVPLGIVAECRLSKPGLTGPTLVQRTQKGGGCCLAVSSFYPQSSPTVWTRSALRSRHFGMKHGGGLIQRALEVDRLDCWCDIRGNCLTVKIF